MYHRYTLVVYQIFRKLDLLHNNKSVTNLLNMGLEFSGNRLEMDNPFTFYHLNKGSKSPFENTHNECIWDYKAKSVVSVGEHGLFGANLREMITIYCSMFCSFRDLTIVELESEKKFVIRSDFNTKHEIEVRCANIIKVMNIKSFIQLVEHSVEYNNSIRSLNLKMVIKAIKDKIKDYSFT